MDIHAELSGGEDALASASAIDDGPRNTASNAAVQAASTTSPEFRSQLDAVWKANLPLIRARLDNLDAYAAHCSQTAQQHDDAVTIAHNFAGSLGIFGYPAASELAHGLEDLLESTPVAGFPRLHEITTAIRAELGL